MTLVEKFSPHISSLRRFSRALTGSQKQGDKYVRMALEALTTAGHNAQELSAKLFLYRIYIGIWATRGSAAETITQNDGMIAARVRRLSPLSRATFLLKFLEGFSEYEISLIIEKDIVSVHRLLKKADTDIENELSTNILIIEDEAIIAYDLQDLAEDLGHTVDKIVATHSEAVVAVVRQKPGLILADVQLADGSSGIDAVTEILSDSNIPVIFITAFPERLLTGERPEPTYLISKPFESGNVKAAISQALFFHQ